MSTIEIRAGGENGLEVTQAKAAAIVRSGGQVTVISENGHTVRTMNQDHKVYQGLPASTDKIKISWPSYGAVTEQEAFDFHKAVEMACRIAQEARRIDHPFAEVPGWVHAQIGREIDWDADTAITYASQAYGTGQFTHIGAWAEAVKQIRKET